MIQNNISNKTWLSTTYQTKSLTQIAMILNMSICTVNEAFNNFSIPIQNKKIYFKKEIEEYINNLYFGKIEYNNTSLLPNTTIDIYLPDKKIAIEFDDLLWHSENKLHSIDRHDHVNKTNLCESLGIHLIHIFENDWVNKKEIVKSRLASVLGVSKRIYARKCHIFKVPSKIKTNFFNNSHISGDVVSKIAFGLMYKNELVSIMSFSKPRYSKTHDYELIRFAHKPGYTVVGGASKLFSHFIKEIKPTSIVSYADRRWSSSFSTVYAKLGFKLESISGPSYFYFNNPLVLNHRSHFQKHKLEKLLEVFDPKLTEWENMKINNFNRIWDCGTFVYIYKTGYTKIKNELINKELFDGI